MIAVDTNILVQAHRADLAWHEVAAALLESLAAGAAPWAIPLQCLHEFLSVVTRSKGLFEQTPMTTAMAQVDALLATDNVVVLYEDGEHWHLLRSLVETASISGPKIHDARIAACCLRHGVSELWTADRDFSRFPALRTRNPLIAVNERRPRYR